MTNQDWLGTLSAKMMYEAFITKYLQNYGTTKLDNNMVDWLKAEHVADEWDDYYEERRYEIKEKEQKND